MTLRTFLEENAVARMIETEHAIKLGCILRGDTAELRRSVGRLAVLKKAFPETHRKFFELWKEC